MTTSDVRKARPNLGVVAPLTNALVVLFIWFNFAVALSLYLQRPNASLIIVGGLFNSYFWSGVFVVLALTLVWGKLKNDWNFLRHTLIAGLFVKFIFTYALVILGIRIGFRNIFGTLILWLAITCVQAVTVMYFSPVGARRDV